MRKRANGLRVNSRSPAGRAKQEANRREQASVQKSWQAIGVQHMAVQKRKAEVDALEARTVERSQKTRKQAEQLTAARHQFSSTIGNQQYLASEMNWRTAKGVEEMKAALEANEQGAGRVHARTARVHGAAAEKLADELAAQNDLVNSKLWGDMMRRAA